MKETNTTQQNQPLDPRIVSLADQILNRIEQDCVKPRSKWYFVFKNDVFWGIGLLSVVIGSLCVAASLFAITYAEISLYEATHDSLVSFLYDTLPLMWVLSIAIFIAIGCYQIRNTRRGYRYSLVIIVGGSLVLSFAGGTVLHMFGFGEFLERAIGNHIPFHRPIYVDKQQMWVNADRGLIAGKIIEINAARNTFTVQDFSGRPWIVMTQDLSSKDHDAISLDHTVKIIGLPASTTPGMMATSSMFGCFVFAWEPGKPLVIDPNLNSNIISETKSERKLAEGRNSECKGIRPYQLLQRLRAESI